MSHDPFLAALADTLLPGDGTWPPASQTQVPTFLAARAGALPPVARALASARAKLPGDFAACHAAGRNAALRELESAEPALVAILVDEATRGYYTDALALAVLEQRTGYPARPPQPLGRNVPPFDWSSLDKRSIGPSHSTTADEKRA